MNARRPPRYVIRAKYPKENIDGYIAKIVRKSGRLFRVFQLKSYGGDLQKCKAAAVKAASDFDRAHPKLTRRQLSEIRRPKNDPALPPGVTSFVRKVGCYEYRVVQAAWSPHPGRQKTKRFNVSNKRPEIEAIALAVEARETALAAIR